MPESTWDVYFAQLQENEKLRSQLKQKDQMIQDIQAQTAPNSEDLDISTLLKEISLDSEEQKDAEIKLLKEQIKELQLQSSKLQVTELNQVIEHENNENERIKEQLTDLKEQYNVELQENEQFEAKLASCLDVSDLIKLVKDEGFEVEDTLEKEQQHVVSMAENIAQLKQENQQLRNQLFEKEKQFAAVSKEYTDAQTRTEQLTSEHEQLQITFEELKMQAQTLGTERATFEKQIATYENQLDSLRGAYDELEQIAAERERDFTVKLNEKQAMIEEKNGQIVDLCTELGQLQPVVSELETSKEQLANNKILENEHLQQINQLNTQVESLEFAVEQAEQRSEFQSKQAQLDVQNALIEGSNQKEAEMQEKLEEARAETEDVETQLRAVRKEKQQLNEDVEELNKRLQAKESEIARLNEQIEGLKDMILQAQKDIEEAQLNEQEQVGMLAADVENSEHSLKTVFSILAVSSVEAAVSRIKELLEAEYSNKVVEDSKATLAQELQKMSHLLFQVRQKLGVSNSDLIIPEITKLEHKIASTEAAEIKFQQFVKDNELMSERALGLIQQLNIEQLFAEQNDSFKEIDRIADKVTSFQEDARRKITQMSQSIRQFEEVEEMLTQVTEEKEQLAKQNNEQLGQITQLKSKEIELGLVEDQLKRDKQLQLELEKQRIQQEKDAMLRELNQQKSLISQTVQDAPEKSYEFSDIIDVGDVEISHYPSDSKSTGAKPTDRKKRRRSSANVSSTSENETKREERSSPKNAQDNRTISPVESSSSFVYKPRVQTAQLFARQKSPNPLESPNSVISASESSIKAERRKAATENASSVPIEEASEPKSNKLNSKLAEEFEKLNKALQEQRERSINSSMSSLRVSPNSHRPAEAVSVLTPRGAASPNRGPRGIPIPNFSSPVVQNSVPPASMRIPGEEFPPQPGYPQSGFHEQNYPQQMYQQPRPVPIQMPRPTGFPGQPITPIPIPISGELPIARPVPIPQMRGVPMMGASAVKPIAVPIPGENMRK